MVSPVGAKEPIKIIIETKVGKEIKRKTITHDPIPTGEALMVRPQDWKSSLNEIVISHLSSINGGVIKRVIKKL